MLKNISTRRALFVDRPNTKVFTLLIILISGLSVNRQILPCPYSLNLMEVAMSETATVTGEIARTGYVVDER